MTELRSHEEPVRQLGASLAIRPPYRAVVFDMDGVVMDTAALHAEAWESLFDEVLADRRVAGSVARTPFDPVKDYRQYVDGRSREDGIRSFLASRGIRLPEDGGEDPEAWSVAGLAARKNAIFLQLLDERGVRVFPGTEQLLRRLRDSGVGVGLVTASRDARKPLAAAEVVDLFDVIVDGATAQALDLPGKPDPAMFLEAAARLGVDPSRAVVVEDAVAGVEAGHWGGFGLVVGIARDGNRVVLERGCRPCADGCEPAGFGRAA